ncbi:MAG: PHP domain-containing protein [Verrucomicrobiia bacterium]
MKKALIFTAGFGEGHNTAARNIRDGLEFVGGGEVQVEVVDLFDDCYGRLNDMVRSAYITAINRTPKLWQGIYDILDQTSVVENNLMALSRMKKALDQLLREAQPDIVCSTYPLYNYLIEELFENGRERTFLQVTMVTDSISVNSLWYRANSDFYLVPNEDTAKVLRQAGVAEEKVRVLGFPVQLAFVQEESRPSLPPPGPDQPPRVLYIINSGKSRAPKIVEQLLALPEIRLTVTVGRDAKLYREILLLTEAARDRVEVIGWTTQMPELLMSHHLVISKAGGATVQEAIAAECPMVVNQVVPGQEEGNYELLRRNHCGVLAEKPKDVAAWVEKAFAGEAALWRVWKKGLREISVPDSSVRIARFLLDHSAPTNIPPDRLIHWNPPVARFQGRNAPPGGEQLLLVDLHTHTTFSDGKLTARELVDFYGQRQFDVLAITDHIAGSERLLGRVCNLSGLVLPFAQIEEYFEVLARERRRAWDKYGMLLLTGLEFNKDGLGPKSSTHLLGVDLKEPIDPSQDLDSIIHAIHGQGGLTIAAHPHLISSAWGKNTLYLWENQEKYTPLIDAWEIGNRDDLFNPIGLKRLPFIANSDFHKPKHIRSWKTVLFCEKDPEAIKACIRANRDIAITLYRDHLFARGAHRPLVEEPVAAEPEVAWGREAAFAPAARTA